MAESTKAGDEPPNGDLPTERVLTLVEHDWCGPLPPPSALQQYEETIPGAAVRLLRMAEAEQVHRFQCEAKALEAEIKEARMGLWFGGGLALSSVVLSIVAVYAGAHWTLPVALVSIPVMGMVKFLIRGRADVNDAQNAREADGRCSEKKGG